MTDPIEDAIEEVASELIPKSGIFIPRKIAMSIIMAMVIGGIGVPVYIAKELTDQGQKIIKIDGQVESTKELVLEIVASQEKRLSRLEDRVYGPAP